MFEDLIVFGGASELDGQDLEFSSEPMRTDVAGGTFRLGRRTGTWTGTVRPLPGNPPSLIDQTEIEPTFTETESELHPAGAFARPRHQASPSGDLALNLSCEEDRRDSLLLPGGVLAYLRVQLRRFKLWATADWEKAERAYAQTPNVRANDPSTDTYPFITQSEPSLAVSGTNPDIVLVGFNDTGSRPDGFTGWARSTNGGTTWTDMGVLLATIGEAEGDPVLVSNAFGDFFFANVLSRPGHGSGIGVWRSTDGGLTFGDAVLASPPDLFSADKPEMAVDQGTGHIFVCWSNGGIRVARSIDNGQTFIQVAGSISDNAGPERVSQTGCSVAVSASHHVHVAWWDRTTNEVRMKTSSNFGLSFSGNDVVIGVAAPPPVLPCCAQPALNGNIRNVPVTSIATDPLNSAKVFIVWDHFANGSSEISFSASTNFGAAGSWSAPTAVNDVVTGDQFQPRVSSTVWFAADPDTTAVRVVWYDRRNDPNNLLIEVYSALTFDSGQTWQGNEKWSDLPFGVPELCPIYECVGLVPCYMGDYISLASFYPHHSLFRAAWGDNRLPMASGPPCSGGPAQTLDPNVWVSALGC